MRGAGRAGLLESPGKARVGGNRQRKLRLLVLSMISPLNLLSAPSSCSFSDSDKNSLRCSIRHTIGL